MFHRKRIPSNKKRRPGSRLFFMKRKASPLNRMESIPFKDAEILKDYVTDNGRIMPRRITGTDACTQRKLKLAIKRARHLALLSFSDGYVPQITPTSTPRYQSRETPSSAPYVKKYTGERSNTTRTSEPKEQAANPQN